MGFPVRKELKLDFLGEGWAGAYLAYSSLTFTETREFTKISISGDDENPNKVDDKSMDAIMDLLVKHFLEGKAFDGDDLVDIKPSELGDLPVDVITQSVELLVGGGEKQAFLTQS